MSLANGLLEDRPGGPFIAGTRISVYFIYQHLAGGEKDARKLAEFLGVSHEQMLAAIQYIDTHQQDVLAVHRELEERAARGNAPEIQAKLDLAHAKFMAKVDQRRRMKQQEGGHAGHPGRQ